MLAGEAERFAARHQHRHPGSRCGDLRKHRCRGKHVLEVVEHQQELAVAQIPSELLRDALATRREDPESQSDGRRDEVGILERRKSDEDDAVGELVEQLGSHLHCEPRLARPAGAGQRDEPDFRSPDQIHHLPDLALATNQGRRLTRQACSRRCGCVAWRRNGVGNRELGIVIQDLPLEALQLPARLDAELVDERPSRGLVDVERVRLAPRAIEREHQLATQPLLEWMLGDEGLELGDQGGVTAELEVRLDPLDQGGQP